MLFYLIFPPARSDFFPRELHLPPQYCRKDHLNVFPEAVVAIVVAIQPHLVGIDDIVVVPDGDFLVGVGFQLGKVGFGERIFT